MKPICAARSTAVRTDAPALVDDTVHADLRTAEGCADRYACGVFAIQWPGLPLSQIEGRQLGGCRRPDGRHVCQGGTPTRRESPGRQRRQLVVYRCQDGSGRPLAQAYRYGEVEPIDDVQIASATEMGSPPGRNDGPERLVAQIIDDLPDKYGRVLELRYLRGFSVQETADELGVTPGNAKVLQHRALSRAAKSPFGQSITDRPDFTEVAGRYSLCPRDSAA